jgi:phosphatidylglycerophosphate synthase
VIVALLLYLASGVTRFPPSPLSKVNTALQVATVILVLLSGLSANLEPVAIVAAYLVAVVTVASGVDYIVRANRIAGESK